METSMSENIKKEIFKQLEMFCFYIFKGIQIYDVLEEKQVRECFSERLKELFKFIKTRDKRYYEEKKSLIFSNVLEYSIKMPDTDIKSILFQFHYELSSNLDTIAVLQNKIDPGLIIGFNLLQKTMCHIKNLDKTYYELLKEILELKEIKQETEIAIICKKRKIEVHDNILVESKLQSPRNTIQEPKIEEKPYCKLFFSKTYKRSLIIFNFVIYKKKKYLYNDINMQVQQKHNSFCILPLSLGSEIDMDLKQRADWLIFQFMIFQGSEIYKKEFKHNKYYSIEYFENIDYNLNKIFELLNESYVHKKTILDAKYLTCIKSKKII